MSSVWTMRRSTSDAKLAGLCGGVARQWGVDPVLIRVGCVLLALSGGVGIVLYVAGWLLLPVEGQDRAPLQDVLGDQPRRWPREAWIAIIAVCCLLAFGLLGSVTPFGPGPAVILALVWYFGYYRHRPAQQDPGVVPVQPSREVERAVTPQFYSFPGPVTPFTEAATAWRQRVEETYGASARSTSHGSEAPDAAVSEPAREPVGPAADLPLANPLGPDSSDYNAFLAVPDPAGLYTEAVPAVGARPLVLRRSACRSARRLRLAALAGVALTVGSLGTADSLGVAIPLAAYFAASLLVLGAALVAATWLGRARGLLPVALLVLFATVATTIGGPVATDQEWGREHVRYTSAADLPLSESREVGALEVDLTGLTLESNATYRAHVDLGHLELATPENVNVIVSWSVESGALVLDDVESQSGVDQSGEITIPARDPGRPTLTVDLSVDHGIVQVRR